MMGKSLEDAEFVSDENLPDGCGELVKFYLSASYGEKELANSLWISALNRPV